MPHEYTIPDSSCKISWDIPKSMSFVWFIDGGDEDWPYASIPVGNYDKTTTFVTSVDKYYVNNAKRFTYYYSWADTYYNKSCI